MTVSLWTAGEGAYAVRLDEMVVDIGDGVPVPWVSSMSSALLEATPGTCR